MIGDSSRQTRSYPSNRRRAGYLIAFALLLPALVWVAVSSTTGLQSGPEFDLQRRWIVGQYTRSGVNPYPVALSALQRTYGPLGTGGPKPRVYAIPKRNIRDLSTDPKASEVLTRFGPPEAVYPPSADLLLAIVPGMMGEGWLHPCGALANLALLTLLIALLYRLFGPAEGSFAVLCAAACLVLYWSPTHAAVYSGQFSILVTICLLLAWRARESHPCLTGLWFALAMLKLSIALPFLILPLIRGRWRTLGVALLVHVVADCVEAARLGVSPIVLAGQWLQVAAYFSQGQFTLQEVVSALLVADTPIGHALLVGFGLISLAWCFWNRAADDAALIDFLCFVSCLWTYHEVYDFVVLLIPLGRRLLPLARHMATITTCWPVLVPALVFFVAVGVATNPLVYRDEIHFGARVARYAARLALSAGYLFAAIGVWRAARSRRGNASLEPAKTWSGTRTRFNARTPSSSEKESASQTSGFRSDELCSTAS